MLSRAAAATKAQAAGSPGAAAVFHRCPKGARRKGLGLHTDMLLKWGYSQGGEGPLDRAAPFSRGYFPKRNQAVRRPATLAASGQEAPGPKAVPRDTPSHPSTSSLGCPAFNSNLVLGALRRFSALPTCSPFRFQLFKCLFSDVKEGPAAQ